MLLDGCGNNSTLHVLHLSSAFPSPKFAVGVNYNTSNVSVYQVNAASGTLTEASGSPVNSPLSPWGVTVHPNGHWVYVASDSNSSIQGWSVDGSTGALTSIATATDSNYVDWDTGITITADGKWLLTADCNANISVFAINQSTGALAPAAGSPVAIAGLSSKPCINSLITVNNKFVYAGDDNNSTNALVAFTFDDTTGALSPIGSPITLPADIQTLATDQNGKYLYVGCDNNNIYAGTLDPNTGAITPITSSAFPVTLANGANANPVQMVFDPQNQHMYVADGNTAVQAYTFNSSTGALTPLAGSPFAAGISPDGLSVDPSGQFLYATNYTGNTISAYKLDPVTGVPTQISGSPYPSSGGGVASIVITH